MEYRTFGQTGMKLSVVGIGGLLAHYEGVLGSEPPEEKRRIYLRAGGKIRALCLIRHDLTDQDAYVERGPEPEADGDLVVYNYVYRYQEPGIAKAAQTDKGVLIMKALGGQWLSWEDMTTTANQETVVKLAVADHVKRYLDLIYPIVSGPWHELAKPGETIPRAEQAIQWVLKNPGVSSILVAIANVAELEAAVKGR
ncbi:TPA: hypothetical protein EYP66_25335 [Candidatus Poribacteria bacterium]|nr:hypothetical protein [Candidatus Poribacteria bacterium]